MMGPGGRADDSSGEPLACGRDAGGVPIRDAALRLLVAMPLGGDPLLAELRPRHPDVARRYL
jgi:hypothetical protein